MERDGAREVDAVLDASFMKAWSIRHPRDIRKGYSDVEAKVGRTARTYGLGFKLHLSIDFERRLPLASMVAPANENEKKHCHTLLERTRRRFYKRQGPSSGA